MYSTQNLPQNIYRVYGIKANTNQERVLYKQSAPEYRVYGTCVQKLVLPLLRLSRLALCLDWRLKKIVEKSQMEVKKSLIRQVGCKI